MTMRVFWTGKHEVDEEGKAFYANVFKELIDNGVTPFVALFHWDLPFVMVGRVRR